MRDVARRAARLAEQLDGGLLPARPDARRRMVQGSAVLMAYLHDIGMVAATPAGRRVHAQFAAHTALGEGFDDLAEELWRDDTAGLRARIEADALADGAVPGDLVMREVLALSLCHSKSVVPAHLLDDPAALRARDAPRRRSPPWISRWRRRGRRCGGRDSTGPRRRRSPRRYRDVGTQAFAWMVDPRPAARRFLADVVDAVRVLRAADALRQRGTTQRTSAGYEICVDRRSGRAVMAMRSADRRFGALMWVDKHHSIAEGNLRVVDLTDEGSLRIAFHRGDFSDDGATERVVTATAATIADIEADVLGSFRPEPGAPRSACLVEVAGPPDNPDFAQHVAEALERDHPHLAGRTVLVDEPHPTPRSELAEWYRRGRAARGRRAGPRRVLRAARPPWAQCRRHRPLGRAAGRAAVATPPRRGGARTPARRRRSS